MKENKKLEYLTVKDKISRREFMVRTAAWGVATAASSTIFSNFALASVPKKGGRLRMGLYGGSSGDTLDPATIADVFLRTINWQIRNCLVEIDYKGNPVPELAESWEPSSDASRWSFILRKDVEFHNGKSMDAEDVIFSINYHREENSKSGIKNLVKAIKDIKSDGKHTVIFTLEEGNADFPALLSDYHLVIVPNNTTDFNNGIGTGGYKLASFEPGVRCFAKRNPNYWKSERAHFDEVESLNIADTAARTNALRAGQIDVMHSCDLKTVHLMKKQPDIQIIRAKGKKHYTFPMLTNKPPYDNNDVRLALKYAVDRQQLLQTILLGYGTLGNDHPICPAYRYFAATLPQREYDPDKAKYHIKKAGMEGHRFNLYTANGLYSGSADAAVLFKEHSAKAGIDINVELVPKDGYWKEIWMKKDWCASYWSGRPTEDSIFSQAYSGTSYNESFFKNDRFEKLLKQARSETSEAKRREMYAEMQGIVRDEGGTVIPVFADFVDAASNKLKFENLSGEWGLDGDRCAERWWFGS